MKQFVTLSPNEHYCLLLNITLPQWYTVTHVTSSLCLKSQDIKSQLYAELYPLRQSCKTETRLGARKQSSSIFMSSNISIFSAMEEKAFKTTAFKEMYICMLPVPARKPMCADIFMPQGWAWSPKLLGEMQSLPVHSAELGNISQSLKVFQQQRAGRAASIFLSPAALLRQA